MSCCIVEGDSFAVQSWHVDCRKRTLPKLKGKTILDSSGVSKKNLTKSQDYSRLFSSEKRRLNNSNYEEISFVVYVFMDTCILLLGNVLQLKRVETSRPALEVLNMLLVNLLGENLKFLV